MVAARARETRVAETIIVKELVGVFVRTSVKKLVKRKT